MTNPLLTMDSLPPFSQIQPDQVHAAVTQAIADCKQKIGDVLVSRGDIGYVRSIGTFLQQFYIYAVEFPDSGHQVGMRAKELCTLDHLPDEVLTRLGERAEALRALR